MVRVVRRAERGVIGERHYTTPLEPGMLLKCSKCDQWHTVHDGRRTSST